jgi:ATP-dependent exoDNAse (exonuclease V) beta subunit
MHEQTQFDATAERKAREAESSDDGFYVAVTRARRRLIVLNERGAKYRKRVAV